MHYPKPPLVTLAAALALLLTLAALPPGTSASSETSGIYTAVPLHPGVADQSAALSSAGGKQAGYAVISGVPRAVTWSGTAASAVILPLPAGAQQSIAYATTGTRQVGAVFYSNSIQQAFAWSEYGVPYLAPSGSTQSAALGASGSRHVGWADNAATGRHALLWEGTPLGIVPVDLNPPGAAFSWANATSGDEHVGLAAFGSDPQVNPPPPIPDYYTLMYYGVWYWWSYRPISIDYTVHAALWHGRDAAAIDLNPAGWQFSVATGVSGGQQVGYGLSPDRLNDWYEHAVRWAGTPESAVDLNPPGIYQSGALSTNGSRHVGYGYIGLVPHALVWAGDVAQDLNAFLPPGYHGSVATGIDADGTISGYTSGYWDGRQHAFLWKPGTGATPSPVRSLTATPERRGIVLTWQPPAFSGTGAVTGYRIYRRDYLGSPTAYLASAGAATTSFKDLSAGSGGRYYYQVAAVNAAGEGAQGSEISAVAP